MKNIFTYESETKTWKGASVPYPFGNQSVTEIIYEKMTEDLEHICQISDDCGKLYTNEEMLKAALSFASALKNEYHICRGDHILLLMENYHYMAALWLGCVFAQAVICPFVFSEGTSIKGKKRTFSR